VKTTVLGVQVYEQISFVKLSVSSPT
jgi:hypothetical protein